VDQACLIGAADTDRACLYEEISSDNLERFFSIGVFVSENIQISILGAKILLFNNDKFFLY
jgi:hypothetical protein